MGLKNSKIVLHISGSYKRMYIREMVSRDYEIAFDIGLLHTWLNKDCSLWSPHAQQTHSERSRWSR